MPDGDRTAMSDDLKRDVMDCVRILCWLAVYMLIVFGTPYVLWG